LSELGRIALGARADLVVFEPDIIAPTPMQTRRDLPAGAARLHCGAVGMVAVYVNGKEVVWEDSFTGELPGRLLRSGRDSVTVPARTA
jgi:N-acyl-D-aspartate/D-glutamate deacylase